MALAGVRIDERVVYRGGEGKVHNAEMSLGPGIVMFGEGDAWRGGLCRRRRCGGPL